MVWAGIWGSNHSDLIRLERDFDSKKNGYSSKSYIRLLDEVLPSFYELELTFMQDNAPIHVSKESTAWFENNGVRLLPDWPSYSPDLNPIENLWFPLKEGVYVVNPDIEKTTGGLEIIEEAIWKAAEASWANIRCSHIEACVRSMKRRCEAVIKAKGWYTGY